MAHLEIAIHPYIGHSDGCPSRASQLNSEEVEGSHMVGVILEATFDASEKRSASPVGFIDVSASWTCYGGVSGLNIDYGDSSFKGFVFNKGLEFSESPAVEASVSAFSMLGVTGVGIRFIFSCIYS
jgi:hypothetical protein